MANAMNGIKCASCGETNPAGMRFCGQCGSPLAPPSQETVATNRTAPESSPVDPVATTMATTVTVAPVVIGPPPAPDAVSAPPTPEPAAPPAAVAGTPGAEAATASVSRAVPPPGLAPAPEAPPAPPKPDIPIPSDPIAREVERDRMQSLAGVQRARGQVTDARETLERVLLLSEGMKPRDIAPVHEQIGDLLLTEGRLEEAAEAFKRAHEIDPSRVGAEKKFANVTLRIADSKGENRLSDAMLRGDSIGDLLADSARYGRRNAGMAMLLSLVPGFGQFYNGQFRKGIILLGIFFLALLIISVSPDGKNLLESFARIVTLQPLGNAGSVSLLTTSMAILAFGVWLYSLVDAPYYAGKVSTEDVPGGPIDKSGWEV